MRLSRRSVRTHLPTLVVLASLVVPVAAAGTAAAAKIRIDNFGQVSDTYYRGAQPIGRDYADLASLGIKTVIDLTSDDTDPGERTAAEHAGMRYVRIPMTTHRAPSSVQLEQFLRAVNDPANQPVYVHCVGGRHRTGVMTAAYRMAHDGWSADRAFAEMKQYKFGADFLHSEFKAFVYDYRAMPAQAAPAAAVATKIGR
jgi:protein tyrosine/serine phosphatase